jgi:replicative DNA helicase
MPHDMAPLFSGQRLELPTALDAERAIISGIMMDAKNLDRVVEIVRPEHFHLAVHGRIYAEQVKRIQAGGVGDALSLDDWFRSDPDTAAVEGRKYLTGLIMDCPTPISLNGYAQAVVQCWERRQGIAATHELLDVFYDRQTEVRHGQHPRGSGGGSHLAGSPEDPIAGRRYRRSSCGPAGLSTGFASIDEALGGLGDDQLIVLAGRPGMGKTGLGWQMAIAAARQGVGVYVASLEMSGDVIKKGSFHNDLRQSAAIVRAQKERRGLPLSIDDGPNQNISQIETKARQAHRRHGLGLIMVDHLNIVPVESSDIKAGATWAVGRISGAMKRLAKTYHCPVLLLAQLDRGPEAREDKRPVLSDLRQSGDIEQDADVVAFVYRAEYYLPKSTPEKGTRESSADYQTRIESYHQMKEERWMAASGGRSSFSPRHWTPAGA